LDFEDILIVPPGINFECTGCGNCCLMWPVPVTQTDFERITSHLESSGDEKAGLAYFKERDSASSSAAADKLNQFPYILEKQPDGRCAFLTDELRCHLHENFGETAKPSMCQLFPYTFTEAPDGFYAGLSFAASGVLFNSGRSLEEQRDFLKTRLALFKKLFPTLKLDWSATQLYDGHPLKWVDYLLTEKRLLRIFRPLSAPPLEDDDTADGAPITLTINKQLLTASKLLTELVPKDADLDHENLLDVSPVQTDLVIVRHLLDYFLPADSYAARRDAFGAHVFKQHLTQPPEIVQMLISNEVSVPLAQICRLKLGHLDDDTEELLRRFVYCRIFSKLYFGAGFGHLSVISGFHHLGLLVALVRIRLKFLHFYNSHKVGINVNIIEETMPPVSFVEVAELIRGLERRLSSLQYSKEVAVSLQVLLESPLRFARIIALSE
jgi:Fe-S-cluster containining protein